MPVLPHTNMRYHTPKHTHTHTCTHLCGDSGCLASGRCVSFHTCIHRLTSWHTFMHTHTHIRVRSHTFVTVQAVWHRGGGCGRLLHGAAGRGVCTRARAAWQGGRGSTEALDIRISHQVRPTSPAFPSLFLHLSIRLTFCLSICLSDCLSVCLSICLSVCPPLSVRLSLSLSMSVCLSVCCKRTTCLVTLYACAYVDGPCVCPNVLRGFSQVARHTCSTHMRMSTQHTHTHTHTWMTNQARAAGAPAGAGLHTQQHAAPGRRDGCAVPGRDCDGHQHAARHAPRRHGHHEVPAKLQNVPGRGPAGSAPWFLHAGQDVPRGRLPRHVILGGQGAGVHVHGG
jgi:hypothetical protein